MTEAINGGAISAPATTTTALVPATASPPAVADPPEEKVNKFLLVREGEKDPFFQAHVKDLVFRGHDCVVFLDDEDWIWWQCRKDEVAKNGGAILNRRALLEALPTSMLTKPQRRAFRLLAAEAMARLLHGEDVEAAKDMLDQAETFYRKRIAEASRVHNVVWTGVLSLIPILAGAYIWFTDWMLGSDTRDLLLGVAAGAGGAFFSVAARQTEDATVIAQQTEGMRHAIESLARVATGMIGAFVAYLAMSSQLVMGGIEQSHRFATVLLVCCVAGLSERIMPSIVKTIESAANAGGADKRDPK